jgi:hypothetical protein
VVVALGLAVAVSACSGSAASTSASGSGRASASPAATGLRVSALRVGDCLAGANMELNTSNPWPAVTQAVPCSQPHTAEVFFADNTFWRASSTFPGSAAISKDGTSACTSAFRSYVGIAYAKSVYTWTNIIPDAATWPAGDRALHCIAYYATAKQPAGVTLVHSIKGSKR